MILLDQLSSTFWSLICASTTVPSSQSERFPTVSQCKGKCPPKPQHGGEGRCLRVPIDLHPSAPAHPNAHTPTRPTGAGIPLPRNSRSSWLQTQSPIPTPSTAPSLESNMGFGYYMGLTPCTIPLCFLTPFNLSPSMPSILMSAPTKSTGPWFCHNQAG